MVRRLANSTVGTRFPMAGIAMKTASYLVMMKLQLLIQKEAILFTRKKQRK